MVIRGTARPVSLRPADRHVLDRGPLDRGRVGREPAWRPRLANGLLGILLGERRTWLLGSWLAILLGERLVRLLAEWLLANWLVRWPTGRALKALWELNSENPQTCCWTPFRCVRTATLAQATLAEGGL